MRNAAKAFSNVITVWISLLFIISFSSIFWRYSVSTEAKSNFSSGSPSCTVSPGFLYTSKIRLPTGDTMISSESGTSFPVAAMEISIGPLSTVPIGMFSIGIFPSSQRGSSKNNSMRTASAVAMRMILFFFLFWSS